jgi:hypothetical protein
MRHVLCFVAVLTLHGCDDQQPAREPGGPLRTESQGANATQQIEPAKAGELPRIGVGPRFIGQWAADQGSCKSDPWVFTETSLHTPAGSTCSFNRVADVPGGGYDIQATCSAEAPPTSDTLEIRFDEEANRMLFESETIASSPLEFCGRTV